MKQWLSVPVLFIFAVLLVGFPMTKLGAEETHEYRFKLSHCNDNRSFGGFGGGYRSSWERGDKECAGGGFTEHLMETFADFFETESTDVYQGSDGFWLRHPASMMFQSPSLVEIIASSFEYEWGGLQSHTPYATESDQIFIMRGQGWVTVENYDVPLYSSAEFGYAFTAKARFQVPLNLIVRRRDWKSEWDFVLGKAETAGVPVKIRGKIYFPGKRPGLGILLRDLGQIPLVIESLELVDEKNSPAEPEENGESN